MFQLLYNLVCSNYLILATCPEILDNKIVFTFGVMAPQSMYRIGFSSFLDPCNFVSKHFMSLKVPFLESKGKSNLEYQFSWL